MGRLQGRQIEMKTGSFEIGHDTELRQGAEISRQALSEFKKTVNRIDGTIGKPSFQESDNTAPVFLNAPCQVPNGFELTELRPFATPAQCLLILVGQDVLEHDSQADRQYQFLV
jgi:hypothetical protein